MLRIALSTLRYRTTAFLASFFAMVAGAAIVMACGGLMEAGLRAEVPAQRLAATSVVVTGDQSTASESAQEWARVDAGLADELRDLPGVAGAVADVSFPATVLRDGRPAVPGSLGHDWAAARLAPYALTAGSAPRDGEVVLDAALAGPAGIGPGQQVELAVAGTTESFQVSGLAQAADGLSITAPSVFFAAADTARLNPHPGEAASIGLFAAPGVSADQLAEQVEAVVDSGMAVLTGDQRGVAEHPEANVGANRLLIMAAVFSGWTVLITVFGVASMIALSVQQRSREVALLRAVGTTPRQIRQMIVGETLVVAVLATALAYVPGRLLGQLLFDTLTESGVATPLLKFSPGLLPGLAGVVAALGAALAAALIAGKRASRTSPVHALAQSAVQTNWFSRARLGFALFFLLGGISQAAVTVAIMTGPLTSATAGPASVFIAIGLALLAPGIVRLAVRWLRAPLRSAGITGELAAEQASTQPARFASAVTPVILLTGIAIGTLYLQETENAATDRVFQDNLSADLVVNSTVGGFAPDVVDEIRALPGVAAASEFVNGSADLTSPAVSQVGGWKTQGITGADGLETTTIRPSAGSLDDLTGDTVALPEKTVTDNELTLGDTVTVLLGDNTSENLRLVAVFPAVLGNERLVLPADLLARHTTTGLPTQILVRARDNTDLTALKQAIGGLGASVPGLVVTDRGTLDAARSNLQNMLAAANYAVVALLVGFAMLSAVNSLIASTVRRRQDFGLLRLSGATRGQVLRTMSVEGLLIALLGIVLGTIASVATVVPFALVKNGSPIPSGPVWIYFAVIGSVTVVSLAATILPAWHTMRVRPVDAVRRAD